MSKLVFFDIDGTIWDWDTNIPESTITAIRALRANGHKAFICSGRSRGNICAPKLFDVGFDGVIAACGNHVEMDGKILYENGEYTTLDIEKIKFQFRQITENYFNR